MAKSLARLPIIADADYDSLLHDLHIQLVRLQRDVIAGGRRLLIIIEGRDGGGKDGTIKRITEHLSPRDTRVVALGKPSDKEAGSWYFQRYVPHLPSAGEMVIFNRSWYNRAGVEKVMGFCSNPQYEDFFAQVGVFESLLAHSGMEILKYYLDISRAEQRHRLAERKRDPLKQWKLSPIDQAAGKKWAEYSAARNRMLLETSQPLPWRVVRADNKRAARLGVIADMLAQLPYRGRPKNLYHSAAVAEFTPDMVRNGFLAP